jgi:uncharacterized BrkB/YihY/UPF0761 family membrane protein
MTKVNRNRKSLFTFVIVLPVLLRFTASGYLGHCIACASKIYGFWLPWSLYCLCFWDLRLLVTLVIVLPVLLRFTVSGYLGHCITCASEIYGFWLPWSLYYLCFKNLPFLATLVIVLPVLLRFAVNRRSTGNTMTKVTRNRKSQKHR